MLLPALVVLSVDLSAGDVLSRLEGYSARALAVVRRELVSETYWYVFEIGELREQLARETPETPLKDVLDFSDLEPAETRQVSGRDTPKDFAGLVLDGDRLVGVARPEPGKGRDGARKAVSRDSALSRALDLGFRGEAVAEEAPEEEPPFVEVPVFYATDREIHDEKEPAERYGAGRGELTWGVATVTIPLTHELGEVERPSLWKLEWREDLSQHIVLLGVEWLDRGDFVDRVRGGLERADRKEALVFVHGFRVTFAEAARRAAQLAYDLRYPGLPMLYSWPSQGSLADYLTDHTNARWTVGHFQEFLTLALSRVGAEQVHVLAHSMGNLPLIETLARFDTSALPVGSAALSEVIFAAPDFDADTFRDLARVFPGKAGRFTLYASSNDQALKLSRKLRSDLVRAGESGPRLVVTDGVDTVDASEAESEIFLGHSYYGKRTVLSDIFYLLRTGNPPGERFGLHPRRLGKAQYWEFVP